MGEVTDDEVAALAPHLLALASQRLGGLDEQDAAVVAAAWAQRIAAFIPGRLRSGHPGEVDRWLRDHQEAVIADQDAYEHATGTGGRHHYGAAFRQEASPRAGALDTLLRLLSPVVLAYACAALLAGHATASGWLFLASAALFAWPTWRWIRR